MKKLLIGAFIGAIILFAWQSVSWTALNIHDSSYKFVPGQDSVMKYLSKQLTTDGEYLVPRSNPGFSSTEQAKQTEAYRNQPWALISFHREAPSGMGTTILIGFVNCFICVLLACLVIRKFDVRYKTFFSLFTSVLTFGVISFLFVWYNQHNWFQVSWNVLWGELVDDFVGWGLTGLWLGWYYKQ